MNIRLATDEEIENWNDHIIANPDNGNVFQGAEFAKQKEQGGWLTVHLFADTVAITVLQKLVFGLGRFWYIPKGPGVTTTESIAQFTAAMQLFAKKHGVFVVKIEPELLKTPSVVAALPQLGLLSTTPIQPNFSTVTVDISADLSTVLASLNQKGRHAIRRAERDGVVVQCVEATDEHCEAFYSLLSETAAGSFTIRSYDYYRTFWQRYQSAGMGQLFFAHVDGIIVAAAFALILGTKSTYKDGASVRERSVYGASHLLQWHVIQWAKENGSTVHDLCGAPPSDQITNQQHPHYGIGRFKTSFNKHVTDYVGAYDIPVKPLAYAIWRKVGERVAMKLHRRKHHESWY